MAANPQDQRKSPQFKSAEKPVSLHPLSFKDAVIALLQVRPAPAPSADEVRDTDPSAGD